MAIQEEWQPCPPQNEVRTATVDRMPVEDRVALEYLQDKYRLEVKPTLSPQPQAEQGNSVPTQALDPTSPPPPTSYLPAIGYDIPPAWTLEATHTPPPPTKPQSTVINHKNSKTLTSTVQELYEQYIPAGQRRKRQQEALKFESKINAEMSTNAEYLYALSTWIPNLSIASINSKGGGAKTPVSMLLAQTLERYSQASSLTLIDADPTRAVLGHAKEEEGATCLTLKDCLEAKEFTHAWFLENTTPIQGMRIIDGSEPFSEKEITQVLETTEKQIGGIRVIDTGSNGTSLTPYIEAILERVDVPVFTCNVENIDSLTRLQDDMHKLMHSENPALTKIPKRGIVVISGLTEEFNFGDFNRYVKDVKKKLGLGEEAIVLGVPRDESIKQQQVYSFEDLDALTQLSFQRIAIAALEEGLSQRNPALLDKLRSKRPAHKNEVAVDAPRKYLPTKIGAVAVSGTENSIR